MRSKLTMMLGAAALFAVAMPISAPAGELDVGPGGVHIDRGYHRDCRTIIEHRTNRSGDDVTVRRRVCD